MKKLALVLVVPLIAVSLAACGSSSGSDSDFVSAAHSAAPDINRYGTDASLIQAGHTTCTNLDNGNDMTSIIQDMESYGISFPDSVALLNASVNVYCPQYASDAQTWDSNNT